MLQHLRPQYAKEFRCIGSDCEDTCCHGLDVVIDQTAYERFLSTPAFEARAKQHFVVIKNPTETQYARIQLTPSYSCPFLSKERLCGVQQELGEHYLADICASYPRITQRIDGLRETSLLLSCPEAARLVLLNPDLVPREASDLPRYHRFTRLAEPVSRANGAPHQFLWEIREFTLLLLQDREYPLWQRLFLLGMFSRRLNEITAAEQLELVPQLLKEHSEMIGQGKLRPAMEGIPARTMLQLGIVLEIINLQLGMMDASHTRFRECVQDFLNGIHFEQSAPLETSVPFYEKAYAQFYQPFMQKHPHIMENYLLNYVFRTRFPYGVDAHGTANDPVTEYLVMCILYAVIKGLLIGISGHYQEFFAVAHVVKLVQTFAKAIEQCPKFSVANYMGLANADGMALLLKNTD